MAQDPVLQREMFNPRDRSARGSGITSMVDDGSSGMTREERLQMAQEMLAEAQMKQNPEYYFNTLAQGDRPAMTRPVASSAPPPAIQPMPAAQQMAQMQAAGVRPVGMADGGIVRIGYAHGGLHSEDEEFIPGLEALKSNPAWSNLTFDQRSQLTTELYNKKAAQRPEAQSRPTIDVLTTPKQQGEIGIGGEDAKQFSDSLTDQSNLSPIELEARAVRAKDKYYSDKAKQIMREQGTGEYVDASPEGEASTKFGRIGDSIKGYSADRQQETFERLKKSLMIADINANSDSFLNLGNLFKEESSGEEAARKADEKLKLYNVKTFGTLEAPDDPARLKIAEQDSVMKGLGSLRPDFVDPRKRAEDNARDAEDYARDDAMQNQRNTFEARREANEIQRIADNNRDYATQDASNAARASQNAADNARETSRGIAMLDVAKRNTAEAREARLIPDNVRLRPPVTGVPGAAVARVDAAAKDAGAGAGPAVAQEPARYSATTTLESIKSDRAKEREDNFNMALIQAGLAMMGGKSSNALANIGEGGMQGIKQFSEQERESSRGYREDVKGVRDEERAAAALAESSRQFGITSGLQRDQLGENSRQFGITSGLQRDQLTETARSAKATQSLAAEIGRRDLDLRASDQENKWLASDAKLALDQKIAENTAAHQQGTLSIQGLVAANAKAETDSQVQYRKDQTRLAERTQQFAENKLPEEVLSAGAYGGWKPDGKGTPPTDEQILRGLATMSEDNINKSLEKIINGPFVDQELKDKAAARFSANLDKLNKQDPSTLDYNALPK